MEYQNILFSMEAGIATITLNRPKEMNSLNLEIIEDLNNAMDECANNKDIRVVVVTGNGKVFSAGDDIKIMDMVTGKSEQEVADIIEKEGYPSLSPGLSPNLYLIRSKRIDYLSQLSHLSHKSISRCTNKLRQKQ